MKQNFEKLILSFALILFFTGSSFSQITFSSFEREIKANIDDLPSQNAITATSECGPVSIVVKDNIYSGGCAGTLMREYVATDECGNKASTSQFIGLIDTTAPSFESIPKVVYAGLDGSLAPSTLDIHDNSNAKLKPQFTDQKFKEFILRTWTVEDNCGNASSFEQKLLLQGEL